MMLTKWQRRSAGSVPLGFTDTCPENLRVLLGEMPAESERTYFSLSFLTLMPEETIYSSLLFGIAPIK